MTPAVELVDRTKVSRIRRALRDRERPHRLGVLLDCSSLRDSSREPREVARRHGLGARHGDDLLRWCEDWGIANLAVHLVVADVLRRREGAQVDYAQGLVDAVVAQTVAGPDQRWRLEISGNLSRLPESTRTALRLAGRWTQGRDREVAVSIGHPGQPTAARVSEAAVRLAPTSGPELAERDLAEALHRWVRAGAGRADWG